MSRSYKKPILTDGSRGRKGHGRSMKSYASRKIRNVDDLPTRERGAYKKFFQQYDICDYKYKYSIDDATEDWEEEERTYPRIEKYYVLDRDEYGKPIYKDKHCFSTHIEYRTVEQGYLHKKYKTLENYLNYIIKTYYRK